MISITKADTSTVVFTKLREDNPDKVTFTSGAHTFASRDLLSATRQIPDASSVLPNTKYAIKRTKDVEDSEARTRPVIVDLSVSCPAGNEVTIVDLVEEVSLVAAELIAQIQAAQLPE